MAYETSTNRHTTLLGACLVRGVRGGCGLSCPVAIGTGFRASAARLQPRAILQVRAGSHFCAPCSRADTQLKLVRDGFWIRARISSFAAYFGPEGMSSAAARMPSGRAVCETAGQSDAASKSLAFAVSLVPQNRKCAPRSSIRMQARLPPRLRPEGASGETLFLTGAVHAAFRGAALFAEPDGRNAPCYANPCSIGRTRFEIAAQKCSSPRLPRFAARRVVVTRLADLRFCAAAFSSAGAGGMSATRIDLVGPLIVGELHFCATIRRKTRPSPDGRRASSAPGASGEATDRAILLVFALYAKG